MMRSASLPANIGRRPHEGRLATARRSGSSAGVKLTAKGRKRRIAVDPLAGFPAMLGSFQVAPAALAALFCWPAGGAWSAAAGMIGRPPRASPGLLHDAHFCRCGGGTFAAMLWPHDKIEIDPGGQVRANDRPSNQFYCWRLALLAGRWSVLALLFAVRATMGFQYQSVASVAPLIARDMGVTLADIGLLVGLYLAPGTALAYPGGSIGRRFGDRPVVLVGLALMVVGGAMMAFLPTWPGQIAGRLVAGVGGVLINVLMSKMVTDWFAGREIATAMAVFVNSCPMGIAAALLVLPPIAEMHGLKAAYLFAALLVLLGLVLLAQRYSAPPRLGLGDVEDNVMPERAALKATIVAGSIWGLYNAGLAMVFAFGPSLLVEAGWPITSAGSTISLMLWLAIISVPLGGFLADRLRLHGIFVVAGCLAAGGLMLLA